MGEHDRVPELSIRNFGYMYLADNESFAKVLRKSQKVQIGAGVATQLMGLQEMKQKYPFYDVGDIILGLINRVDEGVWDGTADYERIASNRPVVETAVI